MEEDGDDIIVKTGFRVLHPSGSPQVKDRASGRSKAKKGSDKRSPEEEETGPDLYDNDEDDSDLTTSLLGDMMLGMSLEDVTPDQSEGTNTKGKGKPEKAAARRIHYNYTDSTAGAGAADSSDREEDVKHRTELSLAAKTAIRTYYENMFKYLSDRQTRVDQTRQQMAASKVPEQGQEQYWTRLHELESRYLRARRHRLTGKAFESIKIIGRGAFGEVRLVRLKGTGNYYALKKLSKAKMVERNQQLHVTAERDALAASNEVYHNNPWVVKLHYSFQDSQYLYLLMEFVPGGDLMSQLIRRETFTEEEAKFFIAETVIGIETIHRLKYAHRDIKPDNLLLDKSGHIKVSDFGLCTKIDTKSLASSRPQSAQSYYSSLASSQQSSMTAPPSSSSSQSQSQSQSQSNRRTLLYSNVGTPDYM